MGKSLAMSHHIAYISQISILLDSKCQPKQLHSPITLSQKFKVIFNFSPFPHLKPMDSYAVLIPQCSRALSADSHVLSHGHSSSFLSCWSNSYPTPGFSTPALHWSQRISSRHTSDNNMTLLKSALLLPVASGITSTSVLDRRLTMIGPCQLQLNLLITCGSSQLPTVFWNHISIHTASFAWNVLNPLHLFSGIQANTYSLIFQNSPSITSAMKLFLTASCHTAARWLLLSPWWMIFYHGKYECT